MTEGGRVIAMAGRASGGAGALYYLHMVLQGQRQAERLLSQSVWAESNMGLRAALGTRQGRRGTAASSPRELAVE